MIEVERVEDRGAEGGDFLLVDDAVAVAVEHPEHDGAAGGRGIARGSHGGNSDNGAAATVARAMTSVLRDMVVLSRFRAPDIDAPTPTTHGPVRSYGPGKFFLRRVSWRPQPYRRRSFFINRARSGNTTGFRQVPVRRKGTAGGSVASSTPGCGTASVPPPLSEASTSDALPERSS